MCVRARGPGLYVQYMRVGVVQVRGEWGVCRITTSYSVSFAYLAYSISVLVYFEVATYFKEVLPSQDAAARVGQTP